MNRPTCFAQQAIRQRLLCWGWPKTCYIFRGWRERNAPKITTICWDFTIPNRDSNKDCFGYAMILLDFSMGISGFRDGYLGTVSTKLGQRIDKIKWMNMYPKVNVYTHILIYLVQRKPNFLQDKNVNLVFSRVHCENIVFPGKTSCFPRMAK